MVLSLIKLLFIMTYYPTKQKSNWTEKHTRFSIKNRLGLVGGNLWKYLLSLGKEGTKIDYILNEFQKYIGRDRGKPHDFGYVKQKFDQLINLGIISIVKNFGHNCYSLIVHHPSSLTLENQSQKNSEESRDILKTEASNDRNYVPEVISSNHYASTSNDEVSTDIEIGSEIDEVAKEEKPVDLKEKRRRLQIIRLCAKFHVLFNPTKRTTNQLYEYPIEEIEQSLELYKRKSKTSEIDNPPGWLLSCLRYRFYEDYAYSKSNFIADMQVFYESLFPSGG